MEKKNKTEIDLSTPAEKINILLVFPDPDRRS